jgi:predicted porin
MKKASLFASAAVASTLGLAVGPAFAQAGGAGGAGGGPFADVPTDHWAYASVDRLQKQGIVIGYPDGTYGGKRAMTRYEFAVAIARLLDKIPQDVATKADLANLATKQQLDEAIKGIRDELGGFAKREDVETLRRLVAEFQTELTTLGVEVDTVRRRLDGVEGRLTILENEFKRVRIGGSANLMVRGNHRRGDDTAAITDYDGYIATGGPGSRGSLLSDTRVLHDLDLNIRARLSETATAEAVLNFGNYLPFLNSIASFSGARSNNPFDPSTPGRVRQDQEQTIYKLAIEAPINLPGIGGVSLAVGRIPVQFTPYTLRLIDVDTYFYNDKTDLGDVPVDGARGVFKIGPVGITAFAAKVDPIRFVSDVSGTTGTPGAGLFAGAGRAPFSGTGGFVRPTKSLINQVRPQDNLAMPVENLFGARATFGAASFGTIGVSFLAAGGPPTPAPNAGLGATYDRVFVYGADINANFSGIGLTGSYTQSDTRTAAGETGFDTNAVRDDDNYAWEAAASYTFGAVNVGAGYRYIGPFFAAPGYWGKIDTWTNPVDIEGPFVRASYALGAGLTLTGEGHFYDGTGDAARFGGLTDDDGITNFRAGLKYGLTSVSGVDLGVEWTRYELARTGSEPRSVFYNIGYGYSFNPTTSFKFLYQIVDYSNRGATGFSPAFISDGGVAAAQFQVKF